MKRAVIISVLGLLTIAAIILLPGCSKQTDSAVAKVGDRIITIKDVDEIFRRGGYRFISAEKELEARQAMLDSMVNQQLLVIGAYESNLENHDEVLRVIEGEKDKFLLDVLFEERIMSRARPSEAEIKDWYVRMGEEIKASHILVETEETAQEVLAKLKEGATFEEMAAEYSIDPSASRNQGDLGWFTWGAMVDNFQEAAYSMKPGEISQPLKTQFGYHIIKVVDRREVKDRAEYSESKAELKNLVTERRKRTMMAEFTDQLKEKYPITIEKPTCQFVLNKLEFLYPDTIGTTPRWRNNIDPKQLNPDESALILGRYDGGQLNLGKYLDNIRRVPPQNRPDFDSYDSLSEIIFQMSYMDILAMEARNEGYDESDKYQSKLRRFKEMAMADVFRNDSIPYEVDIDEGEIQEYYDTHPEEFTTPLRFSLLEIQISDRGLAEKYKSTITSEGKFKGIAKAATLRPGKKQTSGNLGVVTELNYPELFKAASEVKSGQIAGPIQINDRYSVIWIKERHDPDLQTIDISRRGIIDRLTKSKGDDLYNKWIIKMKKRIPIETYEDVLAASVDQSMYPESAPDSLSTE